MSNITTTQKNEIAPTDLVNQAWDTEIDVESKDILIPRILLMQQMSDLVGLRKATAGEFVNSITTEKIGDEQNPVTVIPIHTFKTWVIHHKVNGKFEYLKTEDYTPANANRPREEVILGVEHQNVETINLLAMLEKDMDSLDALPVLFSFRMTSYAAGKSVLTLKTNAARINKPFSMYSITLQPQYVKNDKGNYYVIKFAGAKPFADFEKHAENLYGWYKTFKAGSAKVAAEEAEKSMVSDEFEVVDVEKF